MSDKFQLRKIVSYFFILAIAVVFTISFGPGSKGFEGKTSKKTVHGAAAMVNGQEIPIREFQRVFDMQVRYMQSRERSFTDALARQMGMDRQLLEEMVNAELLAQAAEKRGIATSDGEIRDLLVKDPSFQKDGHFDLERYKEVLRRYYDKTEVEYEHDLRRRMAAEKLAKVVESTAVVSDDEVKSRFYREGNKAEATFVRFLPTMFAEKVGTPKADELATWQKEHAAEIASAYEENKFLYQERERLKARQILIKVAPEATAEQKAQARAKAEAARKEVEGGKDFAQVAKERSEDPRTKDKGGELGEVERMAMDPALADAAFQLEPGKMTEAIDTRAGVVVLKVEGKTPPRTKPLEEVQAEIAKQQWTKAKAQVLAKTEAEKALAGLKAGKKLAVLYPPQKKDAASPAMRFETESKPEATETGSFDSTRDSVPVLGPAPELSKDVFALTAPKPLEKVYTVGEGFAVAEVNTRSKPTEEGFTAQRDTLRDEAMKAKQIQLRESFLKALKKQGTVVTNDALLRPDPAQS